MKIDETSEVQVIDLDALDLESGVGSSDTY